MQTIVTISVLALFVGFVLAAFWVAGFRHGTSIDAKISAFFAALTQSAETALDGGASSMVAESNARGIAASVSAGAPAVAVIPLEGRVS